MILWGIGKVIAIINHSKDLQHLIVSHNDGQSTAINYLRFHPPLKIGDVVSLNKTATALGLGTGGFDFIVSPPQNSQLNPKEKDSGHIMKLRYTPYQFSLKSIEEQSSEYHEIFKEYKTLERIPVLIGELHSMLPILITIFRQLEKYHQSPAKKIVYIMTDGAALPQAFSKHVSQLKNLGWLDETITIGNSYGGDFEAVNIYTGLIAAKYVCKADVVIVLMGPGIVGTGTLFGHTGVEQAININATSVLDGLPITIVRSSLYDKRKRHRGISHHTVSNLKYLSLAKSIIPYPKYIEKNYEDLYHSLSSLKNKHQLKSVNIRSEDTKKLLKHYPFEMKTMGRTIEEDHLFFDFVASAATWLFHYLQGGEKL